MIQGPIDYISQLGGGGNISPLLGGLQAGYGLANQYQQAQQAQQAAQAKAEADRVKMERLNALRERMRSGNFTPADLAEYGEMTSPEMMKNLAGAMESQDKQTQQGHLLTMSKPWAALASGNNQLALDTVDEAIKGYESIGDQGALSLFKNARKMIETDPQHAFELFSATMAAMPGGKEAVQSYLDQRAGANKDLAAPGERAKTEAETKKLNAETLKMELEASRPQGTEIDTDARKIMNTATDGAVSSLLLADQADNLATAFDRIKPAAGWTGNALELLKKATGGQDKFTSLKQEYVKLRNTDVLKNLPPGVASDKDIEIALKAFPDENANPDQIASFLRGTAKLNRYAANVNRSKAEWVNQNGSLGPARSDFTANKIPVKKGTNFIDFTASISIPNVTLPQVIEGDY